MKKATFIIPFAAAILLAGCSVSGEKTSSSDKASSDSSASSSSESSSQQSDSASSESKEEPKPTAVTIDELADYASSFEKKAGSVSGGIIKYDYEDAYDKETKLSSYSYGSDANGETLRINSGSEATYVMKDATGALLTILKDSDGNYSKATTWTGIYEKAAPRFSDYLESYESYGAEGLLSDLVKAAKKNPNKDFAAQNNGEKIAFTFSYFEGSDPFTVYKVKADFAYPTSSEALESLSLALYQYSGDSFTYDEDARTALINEGATISRTDTYLIKQNIGERSYKNDFNLADFAHKGLSFVDVTTDEEDETVETEISEEKPLIVKSGDYREIRIKDVNAKASVEFDPLSFSVISGDAEGLSGDISSTPWGDTLSLRAGSAGDYVVEIANASKTVKGTFKVNVEKVAVTSISADLLSLDFNDEVSSKAVKSGETIAAYTDIDVYFAFMLEPYSASLDDLKFHVFDENWNEIGSEKYDLDKNASVGYGDDAIPCVSFCTSEAGTYWLQARSASDEDVKASFEIVVSDSSDFASILSAATYGVKDGSGSKKYAFAFTPDSTNDLNGSLAITDLSGSSKSLTATYSMSKGEDDYDYYRFEFNQTVPFSDMVLGEDRALYVQLDEEDGTYYALEDTSSISWVFEKHWYADSDSNGMSQHKVDYLDFYDDGTVYGQITSEDFIYSLKCEYEVTHDGTTYYTVRFFEGSQIEEPENEWFDELPATASLDTDTGKLTFNANADSLGIDFALSPKNS